MASSKQQSDDPIAIILADHQISQHLEELDTLLNTYASVRFNTTQGSKWRYQACRQIAIALENGVTVQHILEKLNQLVAHARWKTVHCNDSNGVNKNTKKRIRRIPTKVHRPVVGQNPAQRDYGLNGDLLMTLVNNNCNVDTVITFRGMQCTVLHAIVQCHGLSRPFHRMLVDSKASLDLLDEYGRTALVIAVWRLSGSPTSMTLSEVQRVRALLEYGFSPFVTFRGKTIEDKLTTIVRTICQRNYNNRFELRNHRNRNRRNKINIEKCSKKVQLLLDTLHNLKTFVQRVRAITVGLQNLIQKNIIYKDIANTIKDFVGVTYRIHVKDSKRRRFKSVTNSRFNSNSRLTLHSNRMLSYRSTSSKLNQKKGQSSSTSTSMKKKRSTFSHRSKYSNVPSRFMSYRSKRSNQSSVSNILDRSNSSSGSSTPSNGSNISNCSNRSNRSNCSSASNRSSGSNCSVASNISNRSSRSNRSNGSSRGFARATKASESRRTTSIRSNKSKTRFG